VTLLEGIANVVDSNVIGLLESVRLPGELISSEAFADGLVQLRYRPA